MGIRLLVFLNLYKRVGVITLPVTLLMWGYGGFPTFGKTIDLMMLFIPVFSVLRTICQALIWYLFRMDNRTGFYFYNHFGFSEWQLAVGVYAFEMVLFSVVVWITGLYQ